MMELTPAQPYDLTVASEPMPWTFLFIIGGWLGLVVTFWLSCWQLLRGMRKAMEVGLACLEWPWTSCRTRHPEAQTCSVGVQASPLDLGTNSPMRRQKPDTYGVKNAMLGSPDLTRLMARRAQPVIDDIKKEEWMRRVVKSDPRIGPCPTEPRGDWTLNHYLALQERRGAVSLRKWNETDLLQYQRNLLPG